MAQALQLPRHEELDVSTVRNDMVNICGLYTEPVTGTDPAEGLAGQLSASPPFPAIS